MLWGSSSVWPHRPKSKKNLGTLEASFSSTFHVFWAYDTTFELYATCLIHFWTTSAHFRHITGYFWPHKVGKIWTKKSCLVYCVGTNSSDLSSVVASTKISLESQPRWSLLPAANPHYDSMNANACTDFLKLTLSLTKRGNFGQRLNHDWALWLQWELRSRQKDHLGRLSRLFPLRITTELKSLELVLTQWPNTIIAHPDGELSISFSVWQFTIFFHDINMFDLFGVVFSNLYTHVRIYLKTWYHQPLRRQQLPTRS